MEQKIRFEFEGKTYEADMAFYDTNQCVPPDGRVLKVDGWYESFPPSPGTRAVVSMARAVEVTP